MSEDAVITTERRDGVLVITLNRPEAKNAINRAMAESLEAALDTLEGDDGLRVGILTGAGGTFCSGMDLKAFVKGETPTTERGGFGGLCEREVAKPLIAAVEGYALAGGFELAISCDLIVAAEDAKFGIPEVKRGLAAGAGGLVKLPRQAPPRLAMELALTGDFITAGRAADIGLVNSVVSPGKALEGARALAARIAANGPLAVARSKQVINASPDWSSSELFTRQNELLREVFQSEDAIEGATAFAEKRAPVWKGK